MFPINQFKAAHRWLYMDHGFCWRSDQERLQQLDKWQLCEYRDDIFIGDCEDACLTIMERLLETGGPTTYILRVATEMCDSHHAFDHAILGYRTGDEWWISDNRYPRFVLKASDLPNYKFYDAVSVENIRGRGFPKLFQGE
jgi:predicted transglutaminase-like cysteine proteinase